LLASKLQLPPVCPPVLRRPRLDGLLAKILTCPFTVVSAPPGFGKTTLLNTWLHDLPSSAAAPVWITLDRDDNDPARFLNYFLAALSLLVPHAGTTFVGHPITARGSAGKELLAAPIAALACAGREMVMVLDDFHLITEEAVHALLAFFMTYQPPNMHLVITSRVDPPLPLARWRAHSQLAEIRTDDLRFTVEETEIYLRQTMDLPMSSEAVEALAARTEGWIVGLKLAAVSLRAHNNRMAFVAAFSGSHRHVLAYLVEEVLEQCPPGTLDFLLHTCLLDRLCGPLCDAMTDRADGYGMLAWLEQANLFIVPLDDEGGWYRYHYLFVEMLRSRLRYSNAGAIPDLHRRASCWLEKEGLLAEATHHARAAGDPARAAMLAERRACDPGNGERPGASESLKARELEILRLMAGGASNREIAEQLMLALSTVKWYVHIIFEKLSVDSRTRAIARARELHLV
jgi:LuxR family maltose regulon positive regulatory protein